MTQVSGNAIQKLIADAIAKVPAIEKKGVAPPKMGGYSFRRVEDVVEALNKVLNEVGVFFTPRTLERIEVHRKTGGGGTMYQVDVHVEFTFFGPTGDYFQCSVWGEGTDMGDKATQKAYTAALKSLLTIIFRITDQGDDAEQYDVPESAPRTGPTPDEDAQMAGWADDAERKQVHDALRPGLKKLVDEGALSKEVAAGLWSGLPKPLPMTKQQFDTWIEGVERAKSEHAEDTQQNEQAAEQVKKEFGAEDVTPAADTPTA